MTFKDLKIGDYFKFLEKTKVGCGMYNLVGIKKSEETYRMGMTHRIGNKDVRVKKIVDLLK
jgi:hypothetical protein